MNTKTFYKSIGMLFLCLTLATACESIPEQDADVVEPGTTADAVVVDNDELTSKERMITDFNDLDWASPIVDYEEFRDTKDVEVRESTDKSYAIYSAVPDVMFATDKANIN